MKHKKRKSTRRPSEPFDRYAYYLKSVQSPDTDVEFLRDTYRQIRRKTPETLREDFCGTFAICCEWVKLGPKYRSIGLDLDQEPVDYGLQHHLPKLSPAQRERVSVEIKDVLQRYLPPADLVAALNFSYYIFKSREVLKKYFANCWRSLKEDGLLVVDSFGGGECQAPNEEETTHRGYSYFWDQTMYDAINNRAVFHIHFKRQGEARREKVFTYDWRMWTIPEIRECMEEAGFSKTMVYWEGTAKNGEGDGNFTAQVEGDEADAWIAYVVGLK